MSFEVKEKDLLGRIGKLKTKSGTIETPLLFPVINPSVQPVLPQRLKDVFGFEAVITNAYILKKRYQNKPIEEGLHKFLKFNGATMTDSGAYQILVYGDVEYNQKEIVAYEESIGTDIATILDIPTGWRVTKEQAEITVAETHRRAKEFFNLKTRKDMLWVGPVQGGKHLDLVADSAKEMGSLPFDIHALGSPTEVMENYRYDVLAEMILTAKKGIPIERPLHLFGAGHPSMFAIAVSLGCDLFDSAAYALYAREGRYMTENGTWRIQEMDYFPCTCPNCTSETPKSLMTKSAKERTVFLAEHNLWACISELKRIKQAIRDGRLWELTEMRAHAHPALLSALKRVKNHKDFLETFNPSIKNSGFFYFNPEGLARPEITHYKNRLLNRYTPPTNAKALLLLPQTRNKPFHKSPEMKKIRQLLRTIGSNYAEQIHIAVFCAPFGIVPLELDEIYPLSQHETARPFDRETIEYIAEQTTAYIKQMPYNSVTILNDQKLWNKHITIAAKDACTEKGIMFEAIEANKEESNKQLITNLKAALLKQLSN
ncbi:MAG: tRNA guanosine(15) transglycosylase TgtA [Candidatus Bathyarchaeota archaeon]|nr:tRNA guanosine(15) transglycosylase TgtA [Candidatus Termiticorpusculum sp.]MCL1970843.1 tRNA guanosine(15) transglycosylase TgtA [Candidatus Termiticorpusculum sp.]